MDIPIKRFDADFPLPAYQPGAACFDCVCRQTVTIAPGAIAPVAQNLAVQIPEGYALLLFCRSSTPLRKGVVLANNVGVVDSFYRGDKDEILAFLHNFTDQPVTIEAGDKVVQGMVIRTEPAVWQEKTSFADSGHDGYQHLDEIK